MTELTWEGKYRDGKRVAPVRIALPFQTVETVNATAQDRQRSFEQFASGHAPEWRNRLIWGDKKYVLSSLLPEFAGSVDLIYIDPPFDTGADFSYSATIPDHPDTEEDETTSFLKRPSILEQKAYRDTWEHGLDSYLPWFYETALLLRELLRENGSLYVHLDWHVAHYVKAVLDEVFGSKSFQREIIWRIGWVSGYKSTAANWIRNHETILYYVKNPDDFVFNKEYVAYSKDYVRRDGEKPTGKGYPIEDVWNANPSEFELKGEDSFDSIQIKSFSREKTGYPTQKNESVVRRILRASSNPGDLVLDCFAGSGTTAAVAEKLGRRWIAADLGRFAIHTTRKRLLEIADVRPFIVQNLGKYERQQWQTAQFAAPGDQGARDRRYRDFILDLYHATPMSGHIWLHGMRGSRMVHVGAVDAPVTLADVKAIATELWRAVGKGKDAPKTAGVDVLGWDFAFEINELARQVAAEARMDVAFKKIPREVLEKRAVEQGDIRFFELAALSIDVKIKKRDVTLKLKDFIIPPDDVPEDVQQAIKHWSQYIDYWAVDWDYKSDTFHNEWQTYRTRAKPELDTAVTKTYPKAGKYTLLVKVIDILGNDTTKSLQVEVL